MTIWHIFLNGIQQSFDLIMMNDDHYECVSSTIHNLLHAMMHIQKTPKK